MNLEAQGEEIRIKMLVTVRPELPYLAKPGTILREGVEYKAVTNKNGAVSGICANGEILGVKPGEFVYEKAPDWLLDLWADVWPSALSGIDVDQTKPLTYNNLLGMVGHSVYCAEHKEYVKICKDHVGMYLLHQNGNCSSYHDNLTFYLCSPKAKKNEPLTMEQLKEMDGQPVWLADSPNEWRCFIVNLAYPVENGGMSAAPCGVDMYGKATSLSLLAECGLYRRPQKEAHNA